MPRPVTLFTGQWADLTFDQVCAKAKSFGYDGIELPCWGDHFDPVQATGPDSAAYCRSRHDILAKYGLKTWAISNHLAGPTRLMSALSSGVDWHLRRRDQPPPRPRAPPWRGPGCSAFARSSSSCGR